MSFINFLRSSVVTIGSAGSFSGSVYLGGMGLVGLANDGTWTASPLTFQVSLGSTGPDAGGTWLNAYSSGGEVTVAASSMANGTMYYSVDPTLLPSVYWMRLRSGQAAGGTVQTADRPITLFTRPL